MSKRAVILLILFLSILCITCEDSVPPDNEVLNQIIPLEVGNEWTLRIEWYDSSGTVTNVHYDSFSSARDTIIQNERWFIWSNIARTIATNRQSGYWYRFGNSSYLVLKYPVRKGENYKYGEGPIFI